MNDCDLHLEHKDCGSIKEAITIGEGSPSMDYHILIKKDRIILVMHFFWQKCQFCNMEDEQGCCYLDE